MNGATRGRWSFALTVVASLWAVGLIPAAFLVPVYGSQSSSSGTAAVTHTDVTLVAVNGASVRLMILIALPAVLAALAGLGLHRVCVAGRPSGRLLALTAIGVLGALTIVTGLSIGVEILPALVLLVIALKLTPVGSAPAAT